MQGVQHLVGGDAQQRGVGAAGVRVALGAVPQGDVAGVRGRAPVAGRDRPEQGDGGGGVGDGEVGDAGVAADDGAGAGDEGGQPGEGQAAGEDVRVGQPGMG